MGVILELARAKKRIKELETRIAELEGPPLPSGYPVYEIAWSDLVKNLKALGLDSMLQPEHVPDSRVRYTDRASWSQIVPFLTFPADYYVDDVADCDDYSRWAAADSSRLFKLNGCLQVWGNTPYGYHAWNLVMVSDADFMMFEPNAGFEHAGELFQAGDKGYEPKYWK